MKTSALVNTGFQCFFEFFVNKRSEKAGILYDPSH